MDRTNGCRESKGEASRLISNSGNWSTWISAMKHWIEDIKKWGQDDSTSVQQLGSILPDALYNGLQSNIQSLCKQINASYENNLFDCTAVIMRRLLESLLVLCYQNTGIEADIMDKSGLYHITLDKIIKNATQQALDILAGLGENKESFRKLGLTFEEKAFYDILIHLIDKYNFEYG